MKIYQTDITPQIHELYLFLSRTLPLKFNEKIKGSGNLYVIENSDTVEIGLPEPYEEYLYKIEISGRDVRVSKSEHYTDDVNSLALEDILTDTVIDFIGKPHITEIAPSAR